MTTVNPVSITTPDGVERKLRATLGAKKRIAERFGKTDIQEILQQLGDGALPEIAWCLMFDGKGNPPDITPEEMKESLAAEDGVELFAAVLSAFGQGRTSPNDLAAALRGVRSTTEATPALPAADEISTGSTSEPSAVSIAA